MQEHYLRLIDLDKTIMLTPESNQAMRFGTLPTWALELASTLPSQCFPDEVRGPIPLIVPTIHLVKMSQTEQ
jgi:hypothetical protein